MCTDLASDFFELKRPKSFVRAAIRFAIFLLGAAVLYFIAPFSWGDWRIGLLTGLVAGFVWAISWCWKGDDNRVVAWLIINLGGMIFWGIRYRDIPSLGAIACAYVGFEFMLLVLHAPLKVWSGTIEPKTEDTEHAGRGDGDKPPI